MRGFGTSRAAEVRIRLIEEGDLDVVRELRNRNREWFFDDREITAAQQAAWFESLRGKSVRFYVIEHAGAVIGTISIDQGEVGMEVGNLILDPRYRGQGLMAEAVAELCRAPGTYYARVKPGNDASVNVFERAGFVLRHLHFERSSAE